MSANMDRSLDDILSEKKSEQPRPRRGGLNRAPRRANERTEYPRDGIRKSYRDEPRDLDSDWVHDRYEENDRPRRSAPRGRRDSPPRPDSHASKLKVENIHYELTEDDLEGLFNRIGPVTRLNMRYDRAGRSEGLAYVTYEYPEDARQAIRDFDGANANGQPIRLTLIPNNDRGSQARSSRNPFDTAVMPGRPLSERITVPSGRARSLSPTRNQDMDEAASRGIDRYVPGARSRSPMPPRRRGGGGGGGGGGRRPGARREGGRGQDAAKRGEGNRGGNRRPKKTQDELDAEMADYFGGGGGEANGEATEGAAPTANGAGNNVAPVAVDDVDMIE